MKVAAVVSTKGEPGKTTVGVNLGAFCADEGVRTLLKALNVESIGTSRRIQQTPAPQCDTPAARPKNSSPAPT